MRRVAVSESLQSWDVSASKVKYCIVGTTFGLKLALWLLKKLLYSMCVEFEWHGDKLVLRVWSIDICSPVHLKKTYTVHTKWKTMVCFCFGTFHVLSKTVDTTLIDVVWKEKSV